MADPLNLRTITEFFGVSPAHESAGDGEWAYEVEDGGFRLTIRVQEIRKHIDIALFHGRSIIASIAGEGMASAEVLSDDEGPYLSVSCEIDLVRSEATIRRKPHIFVAWRAFP